MESKLTKNEDSHGYGRFCVSCKDKEIGDIKCCRLTTYADKDLVRVDDPRDAAFLVRHDVMACKSEKGNPILYKTDGIVFDDIDEIKEESSCESIKTEEGTPSCDKGSCAFSTTPLLRDMMGDFTSMERHHVRCGIPIENKPGKYAEKFDCCTKVTKNMKHPVVACQWNNVEKPKMYFTTRWNESEKNVCSQLGEILYYASGKKLSGFTEKELVGKTMPFQGKYSSAPNKFWYNLKALGKNILVMMSPRSWKNVPIEHVLKTEVIPSESGKEKCGWSTDEKLNRHME